ncbi:16S rRNA (cytidine(1402)-2'-O)-methyltransferase [Parvibium lacunae]|uniref:Ribosomal RNA small subunit methyltransferase I n=2 Tax=Parvibium lacunae TaxID=1888893 RepID=A0A368L236_9BURK|nr:16S rRNA (cytidine(1402)-2'-O)-methyltransferase [Parvibium lacunae]
MVATPIGNLGDITLRAMAVLHLCDVVAAEDTRTSQQLLARYRLHKTMLAVHQHNENDAAVKVIAYLQQGQRVAFVSDAGTPGLSDPGQRLVAQVRQAGFPIIPIPGPSALATLLSVAGIDDTDSDHPLHFIGFLPSKATQRQTVLAQLGMLPGALLFYEAPHRIAETLAALSQQWPTRQLVIGRELTKQFEQIAVMPLAQAPAWLAQNPYHARGEFALLVAAVPAPAGPDTAIPAAAKRTLEILLATLPDLPTKQAAQLAAEISGGKKNHLYDYALQLKTTQER